MVRMTTMNSPFLLGFDEVERVLERAAKTGSDGYPPYNIERIAATGDALECLRITLAVAGFCREDVEVTQEEGQLWIRGRQRDDKTRDYIHRGIAARQFQRNFLLAEGMQVLGAELANGLLSIDVAKPHPERVVKKINVQARD
ncbi:MAG TPA: Hsp20 family protein [Roseiarcus sp.]|nr:Hsp20 family protein [Roseiarcus sp.]